MPSREKSTKRALTADDLFRIVLVSDPQASPDGTHLVWVQTLPNKDKDLYQASLWISDADGGNSRQLTSGQHRDNTPRWSPDSESIAFVSNRPHQRPPAEPADADKSKPADAKPTNQVWTIRISGGEAIQRTAHPKGAGDHSWSPNGKSIVFVASDEVTEDDSFEAATSVGPIADERVVRDISYRFDGRGFLETYSHLWTTDLASGETRQLTFGDFNDGSPVWSPDGNTIAFSSNRTDARKLRWNRKGIHTLAVESGEVTSLTPDDASFDSPAWSPDGKRIAFIGHLGTHSGANDAVWIVGRNGKDITNLSESSDISFGDSGMSDVHMGSYQGPQWIDDKSLHVLASEAGETQVYKIDVAKSKVSKRTNGSHRISGFARLGDNLAVLRGSISQPSELELWSGKASFSRISHANDAFLDDVGLMDAQDLAITSADGTKVQAWIIPPFGFDASSSSRHPLILQIHGGPHAMYGYAMFHEMQLMAAKGYAVVFSNPRGSAGYGEEFTTCTRGIWGEADMPDAIATVEHAAALPWIDEDRLGITGGSYGGYLTNWIIGHDNRFKAAVTQRCVSNFYSFFGTSDIGSTFGVHEFDGLPWTDAEKLLKYSPVSYVQNIETPLLIVHSERDLRCPIEQAEQMFAALKYQEKEVGFVRFPEEGHELSRSGTPSRRLARLHHMLGWFDRYL